MEEKKLFLLDAYALIYRAYYGLINSPRMNSKGQNTSAVFGFCNTLDQLLRTENPGYIAVCFDPAGGHTFRHERYDQYKAGRDKQPEDITLAIPYIKRLLEAYRIPAIEVEGYEADDVIGTLSRRAQADGFVTYMMTPDKDYGQLVTDKVFMYKPSRKGNDFEIRTPAEVCAKYGIDNPRQVIDILALEGDSSDNIPGCPGIGPKTASALIREYGSVEEIIANTASLKGAQRKKIEENSAQIILSKELATICTDVPVDITPAETVRREPDVAALLAIFRELEFQSYIARYGNIAADIPPAVAGGAPSLFDYDDSPIETNDVEILDAPAEISAFMAQCIAAGDVGMAVAAYGDEALRAQASGIALANGARTAFIPFTPENDTLLEPLFANAEVTLTGPEIKRDMLVLRRRSITFEGAKYYDTSLAHYLVNPESRHEMPYLAATMLGRTIPGHEVPGKNSISHESPVGARAAQWCAVAQAALSLKPRLEKDIDANGLRRLLEDVELPMVRVLADMEWEGVRIDTGELAALSRSLTARMDHLEQQAFAIAGRQFNVSSPMQVGTILFEEMEIDPKAKKTKKGSWSTAEDVLEKYAAEVPLVDLILQIRALKKLLATYVDALPRLLDPRTGKLHTTFNQTVTATGRISSANPNLQNIPVRTDDGREIRRAFIADPGCLILSADYSQIELRLMADFSGDPAMTEAFREGADIHRATAAKIYHIPDGEVSDTQRRNAKTANFGIIYGISAFGLSERLGIPRAEAKELIEGYLATYPAVKQYIDNSIAHAREQGYVATWLGRRRYLPDINSRSGAVRGYAERNAVNAPLQGSAADIIKVAMVAIDAEIRRRGLRSRMIMQVHDELIFNVFPDEAATLQQLVVEKMEHAYSGRVPLEVSAGLADNWLDAH